MSNWQERIKEAVDNSKESRKKGKIEGNSYKVDDIDFFFIEKSKNGYEIKISHVKLQTWLIAQGFMLYREHKIADAIPVRITDNVVSTTTIADIKKAVQSFIQDLPEYLLFPNPETETGEGQNADDINQKNEMLRYTEELLEKFIAGSRVYLGSDKIELLPFFDEETIQDTAQKSYFFFQNCFVEVTASKITQKKYEQLNGYIWEEQILDRDFNMHYVDVSTIKRTEQLNPIEKQYNIIDFFWKVAKSKKERFLQFQTYIGYALHAYYDYDMRAIVATDSTVSDLPSGRSGKTLIADAIGQMRSGYALIDGKNLRHSDPNRYNKASRFTNFMQVDDLSAGYDFEQFFSEIIKGFSIKDKYEKGFTKRLKLWISTNRTLAGNSGSHEARKLEFETSDFFTAENRVDVFYSTKNYREWFFTWDDDETWNIFDTFMLHCCQAFLKNGILKMDDINLKERRFRDATNLDFVAFALDNFKVGQEYQLEETFEKFKKEYPDFDNPIFRRNTFTSWTSHFAEFKNWKMHKRKSGSNRYISFTN